ncbi:tRNA modification GTPase [uncultured Aquimarina sp.]|uniref:tRNA modification GTPase n=1 Tax=uncultured Aquimarina sp. TaxID=575652 RepID=UPI002602814C|nr:tRNA modification GTPase [uncultured Aquimarina sp.]
MIQQTLCAIVLLILGFNSYGQIKFEKGYFIDNNGVKAECFIKNKDWSANPTAFKYKTTLDSDSKTKTIQTVQEFGILERSIYRRFEVSMDRSTDKIIELGSDQEPQYTKETIFLKVLVDGDAVLYGYTESDFVRFFYSIKGAKVKQLIHKRYLSKEGSVAKNNQFRRQLWSDLRCENIQMKEVQNLDYYKKDLIKYFIKYNTCLNPSFKFIEKKKKASESFNISIRPGVHQSRLTLDDNSISSFTKEVDFGNDQNFRIGLEIEYILPFNKSKWSVFIEPTYQSYKVDEREVDFLPSSVVVASRTTASVDYKSLELPIGIRHNLFVNDHSKIFLNGGFVFDFPLDSKIDLIVDITGGANFNVIDNEITSSSSFAFGIGYQYKKYSIELRYRSNRNLFVKDINTNSKYQTAALIIGYTLF